MKEYEVFVFEDDNTVTLAEKIKEIQSEGYEIFNIIYNNHFSYDIIAYKEPKRIWNVITFKSTNDQDPKEMIQKLQDDKDWNIFNIAVNGLFWHVIVYKD